MHPLPALVFGCGTNAGVPKNNRSLLQRLSPNTLLQVTPRQPRLCTPPARPGPAPAALADVPVLPSLPRQLPHFPRGRASSARCSCSQGLGGPASPTVGTGSPEHARACTLPLTAGSGRTPSEAVAPKGQALQGQTPVRPRPSKATAPRPRPPRGRTPRAQGPPRASPRLSPGQDLPRASSLPGQDPFRSAPGPAPPAESPARPGQARPGHPEAQRRSGRGRQGALPAAGAGGSFLSCTGCRSARPRSASAAEGGRAEGPGGRGEQTDGGTRSRWARSHE